MLSIAETQKLWQPLTHRLVIPRDEASYQQLVEWLDQLIDEVGEDEQHPLASPMDILGKLLCIYKLCYSKLPHPCSGSVLAP